MWCESFVLHVTMAELNKHIFEDDSVIDDD